MLEAWAEIGLTSTLKKMLSHHKECLMVNEGAWELGLMLEACAEIGLTSTLKKMLSHPPECLMVNEGA